MDKKQSKIQENLDSLNSLCDLEMDIKGYKIKLRTRIYNIASVKEPFGSNSTYCTCRFIGLNTYKDPTKYSRRWIRIYPVKEICIRRCKYHSWRILSRITKISE